MSRLLRCLSLLLAAGVAGCAGLYGPTLDVPIESLPTLADGEGDDISVEQVAPEVYAEGERMLGRDAVQRLKQLAKNRPPIRRPPSEEKPVDLAAFPRTHSAIATRILLAATPRGAYVRCRTNSERTYSGLLARTSKNEVMLINCVYTSIGKTVDGITQAIVSYAPTISVEAPSLTELWVYSVPRNEAEASRLLQPDPNDVVREVEFTSGRRHRLDAEPDGGQTTTSAGSLAEVPAGSLVRFSDLKGQRVEGTVLGTESGVTTLRDCVSRVVVQGPDEEWREKTSVLPLISIPASEVRGVVVIKPAKANFNPDDEEDCCDHCVEAFVMASGRREVRGIPFDEDAAQ